MNAVTLTTPVVRTSIEEYVQYVLDGIETHLNRCNYGMAPVAVIDNGEPFVTIVYTPTPAEVTENIEVTLTAFCGEMADEQVSLDDRGHLYCVWNVANMEVPDAKCWGWYYVALAYTATKGIDGTGRTLNRIVHTV